MRLRFLRFIPLSLAVAANLAHAQQPIPPAVKSAEASIDAEKIRAHVRFLADDLLEGRGPGLRGSELAAKYIATEFALAGLKPAGDNGSYLQQINFFGMTVKRDFSSMAIVPSNGAPSRWPLAPTTS